MGAPLHHPIQLRKQEGKATIWEDLEPIVAGGLGVLQTGGGPDLSVLLKGFVGRIGDDQIHRLIRQGLEEGHGVDGEEVEAGRDGHVRFLLWGELLHKRRATTVP